MQLFMLATDEPNGRHLPADMNEVYWGTAAFIVLVVFVWWKAGPAITGAIQGRTKRIQGELDEARSARESAEQELSSSTADLPDVEHEADRIRNEAVDTAARLKTDLVQKAHTDAAGLKERAEADIESSKRQALADLREEVAQMTRGATEEIVTTGLDEATHRDLIDSYINQVSQAR